MKRQTMRELANSVLEEMKRTHHNGSLLGINIDVQEDENPDDVWEDIMYKGAQEIKNIQKEVNAKYGLGLTLDQFGRSSATVAPIEWYIEDWYGCHFTIDVTDYEELEGYNQLVKILGALTMINERCRAWCRSMKR